MNITAAQVDGLSRAFLALITGIALAYGIGDSALWAQITSAILAMVTIGWSIWSNTQTQILTAAAASPDVVRITTTTNAVADAVPSPKVMQHDPIRDIV